MTHRILTLICLLCFILSGQAQQSIDLSGLWSFQIDREGVGEEEQWFNGKKNFDDTILLPGSMPERLKGDDPTLKTQWTGTLYDSSFYFNPAMGYIEGRATSSFLSSLRPTSTM